MPKVSRATAQVQDHGIVEDRHGELEGYTVSFVSFRQDVDATPLLEGLPDDRCQCPHWGYVVSGRMTMRYGDREEVFEAGDAFYAPPGHVPVQHEPGTEIVQFSPTEELRVTEAAMMENMQRLSSG
jgi:Cupin domain